MPVLARILYSIWDLILQNDTNMKKITAILLTLIALGCNAQEPTTHTYYTLQQGDSLKEVILNKDAAIADKDAKIRELNVMLIHREFADTTSLRLSGITDNSITSISKQGVNIVVSIQNENKRITSIFENGNRSTWFFNDSDTSKSTGSFQLDNADKVIIMYDPNAKLNE